MKGIEPLLEAIEQEDTGYLTLLVGAVNANSKEEADAWGITKRIKALQEAHPERLRWLDYQTGQDLKDLYACATIGLMPSIHEPFGIVALEMMAMGIPLISTEVDGLGEIVADGSNEYSMIIPPNRPDHILQAMKILKAEDVRLELRELGLKRVKDFSWEEVAAKTVDVYRQAILSQDARTSWTALHRKEY